MLFLSGNFDKRCLACVSRICCCMLFYAYLLMCIRINAILEILSSLNFFYNFKISIWLFYFQIAKWSKVISSWFSISAWSNLKGKLKHFRAGVAQHCLKWTSVSKGQVIISGIGLFSSLPSIWLFLYILICSFILLRSAFKLKIKVKSQKVGTQAKWLIRPALILDIL